MDHWCALRVSGEPARSIRNRESSVSSLKSTRSRRSLARIGASAGHNTLFCVRSLATRGPDKMYRSDRGYWPLIPRSPTGRPLCPLCGAANPDAWHAGFECPSVEPARHTARTVMRSLLASSSSSTEGQVPLASTLQCWLGDSFGIPDLSLSSFDKWGQVERGPALIFCLPGWRIQTRTGRRMLSPWRLIFSLP